MHISKPKLTLGVIFRPSFASETLPEYTRKAEAAGFDDLWLWDDCFYPGALTNAAIALAATQNIKVGIGLIPATAYNPVFAAMEITTLACAFPNRLLPGFGHGVSSWMKQIGAVPQSTMQSLQETVTAVRRLLNGELVTMHGSQVNLESVQILTTPACPPPLYIGALREKTLRLAGRLGNGTILPEMSSPAYVRWTLQHIQAGMAEANRQEHRVVVYVDTKVSPDGKAARTATRQKLAARLPWMDAQIAPSGFAEEVAAFMKRYDASSYAEHLPDEWVDALTASGTPEQAAASINRLVEAGADTIVLLPLDGDPTCLDEYNRYLMPLIKTP